MFADQATPTKLTDDGRSLIASAITWAATGQSPPVETLRFAHSCVIGNSGTTAYRAIFVVENIGNQNTRAPEGMNAFFPQPANRNQPTWFKPGKNLITVDVTSGPVTWNLGRESASLSTSSAACLVSTGELGSELVLGSERFLIEISAQQATAGTILPSGVGITPGSTPDSFFVSHDGAAVYSIPIWTPPSPGLNPSIALSYSSANKADQGTMGAGFGLSGLSEIRRCKKSLLRDGQPSAIKFRRDDAYCVDGSRLVPLFDNGNTIEFRTEVDSFARIIGMNVGPRGPEFFKVFRKDGVVALYGSTVGSRLEGTRRIQRAGIFGIPPVPGEKSFDEEEVILAWGINEERDRTGSTLTIEYEVTAAPSPNPFPSREWKPTRIRFAANTNSGRKSDRGLKFNYTEREPVFGRTAATSQEKAFPFSFVAGFRIEHRNLLSSIEVYGPGTADTERTLRRYVLDFKGDYVQHPVLKSVTECDEFAVCKAPTELSWESQSGDGTETIDTDVADIAPAGMENYWVMHVGDYNGDGRSDILYRALTGSQSDHGGANNPNVHEAWTIRYSQGLSFGPPVLVGETGFSSNVHARLPDRGFYSKWDFGISADFNMDGMTDFAGIQSRFGDYSFPHWRVMLRDVALGLDSFRWTETDANHSGIVEPWEIPELQRQPELSGAARDTDLPYPLYVADLDGDALPDLIQPTKPLFGEDVGRWMYRKNLGNGFSEYKPLNADIIEGNSTSPGQQFAVEGQAAYTHDLDGDGRVEFLFAPFDPDRGDLPPNAYQKLGYLAFTLENGFGHVRPTNHPLSLRNGVRTKWTGDFNGDGLEDFVTSSVTGGRLDLSLNTGAGFVAAVITREEDETRCIVGNSKRASIGGRRENGLRIADMDRDGDDDIVLLDGDFERFASKNTIEVLFSEPTATGVRFRCGFVLGPRGAPQPGGSVPGRRALPPGSPSGSVDGAVKGIKNPGYRLSQVADVDGDGLPEILQMQDGHLVILHKSLEPLHHLSQVTTGLGSKTKIIYGKLSNSSVHQVGSCKYPLRCVAGGRWVVSGHSVDNGIDDGGNVFSYKYEGARVDLLDSAWLGFTKRTIVSSRTGYSTTYEFDPGRSLGPIRPFGGMPTAKTTTVLVGGAQRESILRNSYSAFPSPEFSDGRVNAIRLVSSAYEEVEKHPDLPNGKQLIANVITATKYDDYFNETYRRVESFQPGAPDGEGTVQKLDLNKFERTTTYHPIDKERWLLSMEDRIVDRSTIPDGRSQARTIVSVPDFETGLLKKQLVEPDGLPENRLEIEYERNAAGLVTSTTSTDATGKALQNTMVYDRTGLFPSEVIDAEGHKTSYVHHPAYGVVAYMQDSNDRRTVVTYDGFLRTRTVDVPGLADETFEFLPSLGDGPPHAMVHRRTNAAGPQTMELIDRLGRVVQQRARRATSGEKSFAYSDVKYDVLGRIISASAPYFVGDTIAVTSFTYDKLNRPLSMFDASGAFSGHRYLGRESSFIDPANRAAKSVVDLMGRTTKTERSDREGPASAAQYEFAPFGNVEKVTTSGTGVAPQVRRYEFDNFGRTKLTSDPDSGQSTVTYDAFGRIVGASDALGTVFEYELDGLGRGTRITDKSRNRSATFGWDNSPHGVGQLSSATSFDGVSSEFSYSGNGLIEGEFRRISGVDLSLVRKYDSFERLSTLRYPNVNGQIPEAGYTYDPVTSEVSSVKFQGAMFWTASEKDAEGRTRKELLGNGISSRKEFDIRGMLESITSTFGSVDGNVQLLEYSHYPDGNLKTRADFNLGSLESFAYDDHDRLKTWAVQGQGEARYDYDVFGNLKMRTSVNGMSLPSVGFSIGGDGFSDGGPNVVKSTTWGASYSYNAKGNQTAGGGRKKVDYNAMDLPERIELNSGESYGFAYDFANGRARKESASATTLYMGELYEQRQRPLEPIEHIFHVVGESPVADVSWTESTNGGNSLVSTRYLHLDRLGSIDAITDQTGQVKERRKYDPFGASVDLADLSRTPAPGSYMTLAGFTGHYHDPDVSIVNMRGRVFDARLMRFLTTDPVVSAPADVQGWNPYSYVMNNPLGYVDPTGFKRQEHEPIVITVTGTHYDELQQATDAEVPPGLANRNQSSKAPTKGDETTTKEELEVQGGQNLEALKKLPVDVSGPVSNALNGSAGSGHMGTKRAKGGPGSPLFQDSLVSQMDFGDLAKRLEGAEHMAHWGSNIATMVPIFGGANAGLQLAKRPGFWGWIKGVLGLGTATRGGALPGRLARVIPGGVNPTTLGRPGTADVFVTAADDIAGMTSPAQIAERLTIPQSKSFTVIEFATPAEGLASPVFRANPGFIGGGRTAGGAREFVLPNMSVPPGATLRRVGP